MRAHRRASHLDAFLSWTACAHLPTGPTAGPFRADGTATVRVARRGASVGKGTSGPSCGLLLTALGLVFLFGATVRTALTSGVCVWASTRPSCAHIPVFRDLALPVQKTVGPRIPWEQHRTCSARVPDDWIVGILQYEWLRRPDPEPSSRRLISAAAHPNNAYRVYQHGANMFMVHEVGPVGAGPTAATSCAIPPEARAPLMAGNTHFGVVASVMPACEYVYVHAHGHVRSPEQVVRAARVGWQRLHVL
jgi:hypothetical protein